MMYVTTKMHLILIII